MSTHGAGLPDLADYERQLRRAAADAAAEAMNLWARADRVAEINAGTVTRPGSSQDPHEVMAQLKAFVVSLDRAAAPAAPVAATPTSPAAEQAAVPAPAAPPQVTESADPDTGDGTLGSQILALLASDPSRVWRAAELAERLVGPNGAPHRETTRKIANRLESRGQLRRSGGSYQGLPQGDAID